MSYNTDFYSMYESYLREPTVRKNHGWVLRTFSALLTGHPIRAVDLGCGLGEFRDYCPLLLEYHGVDVNSTPAANEITVYTLGDVNPPFDPTCFVSLFSAEPCLHPAERTALYDRMFARFPTIRAALVSGFYYQHAADQQTVGETGGLVSYQTIEPLDLQANLYSESRIVLHTPSAMFGDDVVEVWKILQRR